MNTTKNRNIITGSTLKIIAIITMLIDHTAAVLIDGLFISKGYDLYSSLYYLNIFMRLVGRIAFPIFVFLLIEGATHTRSKLKYAMRLLFFAILSEIPFDLAFNRSFFYFNSQNVFFTLAIGMFMILAFDLISTKSINKFLLTFISILGFLSPPMFFIFFYKDAVLLQTQNLINNLTLNNSMIYLIISILLLFLTSLFLISKKKRHGLVAAKKASCNLFILFLALACAIILKSDYSEIGVLTIAIMYILRALKTQSFFFGCLVLIFSQPIEITALLGLIPIHKYNGTRGLKLKYIFYFFYPLHLLLLYFISLFINHL